MSEIRVLFLGAPNFYVEGQQADVSSAKATALLAYLAVTGVPQTRDFIADLLWPDSLPGAARKNLRNVLWALRKSLGAGLLADGDPDRLQLSAQVWSDVATFEAAEGAAAGEARAAARLYRGSLLDGLAFDDAPELEIWLATERERYERMYLRLLDRLVATHRAAGDWAAVIDVAEQALAVDPLQEPMYRALMEANARLGDRAEALRQYERLEGILARELDVEALPETENLRQAILDGKLNPSAPAAAPAAPPVQPKAGRESSPPMPFVGRRTEKAILDEELQRAAGGEVRVVVLSGELGIGKTRLWQEWSGARPPGAITLAARCLDTTQSLPFAPLIQLLHQQVCLDCLFHSPSPISPIWLAELGRLMPEVPHRWPNLPVPIALPQAEERQRLFEAFVQVLQALNGEPLVLFVDDAHWIDRATLDWLVYLVERLANDPLLLVIALRPDEEAVHLGQVLAGWSRRGLQRQLNLSSLTLEEAAELLAALGMDPALARSLQEKSGGNPYFLLELRNAPGEAVPPELAQLVRSRLDRLPGGARQVAHAAAILDAGFEFVTLRRTSGRGEEETLDALDALLNAAVLTERQGRYEFVHPLVAAVVRNDLSIARRSFLSRRAAEALEASHAGHLGSVAGQLARHYAEAGRTTEAAHYAEMAAEEALSLTAVDEAVAFFHQVLTLEPTAWRRMGLGRALVLQGNLPEARQVLDQALAEFGAEKDKRGAARACSLLAESYLPSGQGDETILWAERALANLDAASDAQDLANAHYLLAAGLLQAGGRLAETEAHLAEVVRLAAENDLDEMSVRGRFELGNLLAQRGDLAQALESFELALHLSQKIGLRFLEVLCHNNLAFHALLAGDLVRAKEQIRQGLEMTETYSLHLAGQYLYSTQGEIALAEGNLDEAEEWFRRALDEAEKHENQPQAANIQANQGLVAQARGEFDEALASMEAAYRTAAAGSDLHLQIKIELWLAELHLARDERDAAGEMLARAEANLAGGERQGLEAWARRVRAAGGFPPAAD